MVEKKEVSSPISDNSLVSLIRIFCILIGFSFCFPWILFAIDSVSPWVSVLGLGFGIYNDQLVFSPTLFLLIGIYGYFGVCIWRQSKTGPNWNHLRPAILGFAIMLFHLLSKRQQAILIFSTPFQYRTAQSSIGAPHPSVGFFIYFFAIVVLNGLIFARAYLGKGTDFQITGNFSRNIIFTICLFLTPLFIAVTENEIQMLFGIGYGFIWNSGSLVNGLAFGGSLINMGLIFGLMLLIPFHMKKKTFLVIGSIVIGMVILIFATLGYVTWRQYIPGGEIYSVYPPISAFIIAQFWGFANIVWEIIVIAGKD